MLLCSGTPAEAIVFTINCFERGLLSSKSRQLFWIAFQCMIRLFAFTLYAKQVNFNGEHVNVLKGCFIINVFRLAWIRLSSYC